MWRRHNGFAIYLETAMYICLNRGTAGAGLDLPEFVKLSATAGFHGADVDVAYGVKHGTGSLRDLYATHGQKFGGWGPGDWRSDEHAWKDSLKELERQAKVAGELKIDSCATWIMPSSDRPFTANWRFHVERLKGVADILHSHGLRLGLEFVAPYHLRRKFPHEFVFTPGLMLELASDIGPDVGLLVDCFHCHTAGETWAHLGQIPKEKIVLAHLNDAPRVRVAEVQDCERVLPGEGAIDTKAYLAALKRTGYAGPVSLEVFNASLRAMPPAEAAKRAWQSCAGLLP
jgi:sugar phosphate isomerase/epimerase